MGIHLYQCLFIVSFYYLIGTGALRSHLHSNKIAAAELMDQFPHCGNFAL